MRFEHRPTLHKKILIDYDNDYLSKNNDKIMDHNPFLLIGKGLKIHHSIYSSYHFYHLSAPHEPNKSTICVRNMLHFEQSH